MIGRLNKLLWTTLFLASCLHQQFMLASEFENVRESVAPYLGLKNSDVYVHRYILDRHFRFKEKLLQFLSSKCPSSSLNPAPEFTEIQIQEVEKELIEMAYGKALSEFVSELNKSNKFVQINNLLSEKLLIQFEEIFLKTCADASWKKNFAGILFDKDLESKPSWVLYQSLSNQSPNFAKILELSVQSVNRQTGGLFGNDSTRFNPAATDGIERYLDKAFSMPNPERTPEMFAVMEEAKCFQRDAKDSSSAQKPITIIDPLLTDDTFQVQNMDVFNYFTQKVYFLDNVPKEKRIFENCSDHQKIQLEVKAGTKLIQCLLFHEEAKRGSKTLAKTIKEAVLFLLNPSSLLGTLKDSAGTATSYFLQGNLTRGYWVYTSPTICMAYQQISLHRYIKAPANSVLLQYLNAYLGIQSFAL